MQIVTNKKIKHNLLNNFPFPSPWGRIGGAIYYESYVEK
jgi:hypothetical protein